MVSKVLSDQCKLQFSGDKIHMGLVKVIVEKHEDGFVAYPLGLKGTVVGEGDSFEEAVADVTSAIKFHIETFGEEELETDGPILDVFIAEADVAV